MPDLTCPPITASARNKQILILVFVTIVSMSPFLKKAVHIDDGVYLDFAQRLSDLKNFYTAPYDWLGTRHENIFGFTHPPLIPAFDFVISKMFPGATEAAFHTVYLAFTIGAVVFTYLFCLRFSSQAFLIALATLFSPTFFVQAQSLMTDTPLYCFLAGSLFFYTRAVDTGNKASLVCAILLFTLALGAGFQAGIFYAAFFLYSYFHEPKKLSCFWAMGAALLPLVFLFSLQFMFLMNHLPQQGKMAVAGGSEKKTQILYFLCQFSLAYLTPIGFILAIWRRQLLRISFVAGVVALLYFLSVKGKILSDYSHTQKGVLFAGLFFTFLTFGMILTIFFRTIRSPDTTPREKNDQIFLTLTTLIFIPICLIFTPFGASRYLMPIMVFVLLLILRDLETFRPRLAAVTLFFSLLVSLCAAGADYRYAGFYKKFAARAGELLPSGKNIRYVGEWGLRYYMEKAGYKHMILSDPLTPGDFIIEPKIVSRLEVRLLPTPVHLKKELAILDRGLKVLNYSAHAGFWGHHWGLLPFWPNNSPLELMRIYEAQPSMIPFNDIAEGHPQWSQDLKLEPQTIGGETREALTLDVGKQFDISLHPDSTYRFQFGVGLAQGSAHDQDASPVLVKVFAESTNERLEIFSQNLAVADAMSHWNTMEIDLARYKNRSLKLVFEIKDNRDLKVLWSSFNLTEVVELSF